MFEEMFDENDLEWTEHRLRVHVMTLKKSEDLKGLFRLYGTLAHVLARRGNHLAAQDALNDAEFLVVEHNWRGQPEEIWCHYDRAMVFHEFGRPEVVQRNLARAQELLQPERDEELAQLIETARAKLLDSSPSAS